MDADGQPLSKSALKKLKAKEEKAKKKAEHKKDEGKGAGDEAGKCRRSIAGLFLGAK